MRIGQVKMLHNSFLFLIFKLFPYIKTPLLLKAGGFLSSEKVGFFYIFPQCLYCCFGGVDFFGDPHSTVLKGLLSILYFTSTYTLNTKRHNYYLI